MAVIFKKTIHSRLDKAISYIGNKRKTLNENYEEVFLDLHNALEYTADDLKTEQKFFVDGINCRYETALKSMMDTKKDFGRVDNVLGYHIIQSFAPGEGTPETIHELGKEFARRAFGDRFEVVVATHLNTGCLHNHFVLNSVSYIDGKKYHDNNESFAVLKKLSDEICREYGLSVIENPRNNFQNYSSYMESKNGEWTKDAIIRRDIDECIKASTSPKGFYREMQNEVTLSTSIASIPQFLTRILKDREDLKLSVKIIRLKESAKELWLIGVNMKLKFLSRTILLRNILCR